MLHLKRITNMFREAIHIKFDHQTVMVVRFCSSLSLRLETWSLYLQISWNCKYNLRRQNKFSLMLYIVYFDVSLSTLYVRGKKIHFMWRLRPPRQVFAVGTDNKIFASNCCFGKGQYENVIILDCKPKICSITPRQSQGPLACLYKHNVLSGRSEHIGLATENQIIAEYWSKAQ